jgi:hypothetical protein
MLKDDTGLFNPTRALLKSYSANRKFDRSEIALSLKEKEHNVNLSGVRILNTGNAELDTLFLEIPFDVSISDASFSEYRLSKKERFIASESLHHNITYGYLCDCCGELAEAFDDKIHFTSKKEDLDEYLCTDCVDKLNNSTYDKVFGELKPLLSNL